MNSSMTRLTQKFSTMAAVALWARPHTWGLGLVCLDPGHHPPTPWCPWHGILYPALGKFKEFQDGTCKPRGVPRVFVQLSVWEECLLGPLGRPQGASHWGAAARADWTELGQPHRSPSVDVWEAVSSWVEVGGNVFFCDVVVLVLASRVAFRAETGMDSVDRGN